MVQNKTALLDVLVISLTELFRFHLSNFRTSLWMHTPPWAFLIFTNTRGLKSQGNYLSDFIAHRKPLGLLFQSANSVMQFHEWISSKKVLLDKEASLSPVDVAMNKCVHLGCRNVLGEGASDLLRKVASWEITCTEWPGLMWGAGEMGSRTGGLLWRWGVRSQYQQRCGRHLPCDFSVEAWCSSSWKTCSALDSWVY